MKTQTDKEFLEWLVVRLINVYGESPRSDLVIRLHEIADKIIELEGKG